MKGLKLSIILFFVVSVSFYPTIARAEEISGCANIISSGNYYLIQDILNSPDKICINITASNVLLDCKGHIIDGTAKGLSGPSSLRPRGIDARYLGTEIWYIKNVTIKNCILTDWWRGISYNEVREGKITNITIIDSSDSGIFVGDDTYGNVITNVSITDCNRGVSAEMSWGIKLTNVTINNAKHFGVYFYGSDLCKIENAVIKNSSYGIYFDSSSRNIIKDSRIENCENFGIYLREYAGGNNIYNNFFNDTNNVEGCENTVWNATKTKKTNIVGGPNTGGNYWATPDGSGYSQTCSDTNYDGFCDIPYTFNYCKDYLPLTNPPPPSLSLKLGWNMFSPPVNTAMSADDLRSQCGTTRTVWHYSGGSYEGVASLNPGLGYWIKLDSVCTVVVEGNELSIEDFPSLSQGWNQIGAPTEAIDFSTVTGDCVVRSGSWKYNPETGKYEKSDVLEPGYGYWVKVESDCNLG